MAKGKGLSLFGRNWMYIIMLNWTDVTIVRSRIALDEVLEKTSSSIQRRAQNVTRDNC